MVETVGGYDYKYITEVPEDLFCSLCHFPFKDPVHIEECGHIYCKECFEQTKDHAEANALDFCCPLDRHKIDVTRVFKDKFNERKVLSLKVECRNFPDGCSWIGELRDAADHEEKCGKNEKLKLERFEVELKNISSCVKDLTLQVKCNEQRLEDKDKQIYNQNKLIENQKKQMENCNKQIEDQNILMEKQMKRMENYSMQLEDQNKLIKIQSIEIENLKKQSNNANQENQEITDLKKQVQNINKELRLKMDNQSYETEKHEMNDEIEKLKHNLNNMILPNVDVDPNFAPLSTAFQWKVYVKPDEKYVSPKFYNMMNGMCFQLQIELRKDGFSFIILNRYRGKYDHPTNEVSATQPFELVLRIFGNNGNFKKGKLSYEPEGEFTISQSEMVSSADIVQFLVKRDDISKFAIDGYLHIHLFFNKEYEQNNT